MRSLILELPGINLVYAESVVQAVLSLLLDSATVYWSTTLANEACDIIHAEDPRKQLVMYPLCMYSESMLFSVEILLYANAALIVAIQVIMSMALRQRALFKGLTR